MTILKKISWRANLLRKAIFSGRATNWPLVFREIFSSHPYPYLEVSLVQKDGDFSLYQVGERKVWFPSSFSSYSFWGLVYQEVFIDKVYENGPCVVGPEAWVVDAGACEGFFSLYALEKGARVLAFEPVLEVARALEKTLSSYIAQGRARVFPLGLGQKREDKEMFLLPTNPGANTFMQKGQRFQGGQMKKASLVPLDEIVADLGISISFLKADVEGYERELLWGAQETIRRDHPSLSICTYHLPDDWKEIPRIVKSLGVKYRLHFSPLFDHIYGVCSPALF